MSIIFDSEHKVFKLDTNESSYAMEIFEGGHMVHLYYGAKIPDTNIDILRRREGYCSSFSPRVFGVSDGSFAPDMSPFEYPTTGIGDYRLTSFSVRSADGDTTSDLRYVSHKIYSGKPKLEGLPASYTNTDDEAETLELHLTDKYTGVDVIMLYTVFENAPVMARSVKVVNNGNRAVTLLKAASATVHLPIDEFEMIHMYGCYAREHFVTRTKLGHETTSITSTRGSSGHNHNPFAAYGRKGYGEENGEVYGVSLLYSGDFSISADTDFFGQTRVTAGINPEGFAWHLEPGESFQVPETVTVYSNAGLGKMSRVFHRFFSNNLIRGEWKNKKRPLLINSWEAVWMNVSKDVLVTFAKKAKELGFDLIVMDDGWFGHRNNDTTSLGDWYVNEEKIPGGISPMIEEINSIGMNFGIWYEPEMISEESDIYKEHPDWAMHHTERPRSEARHQMLIDMTRKEVRDDIFNQMSEVISKNNISYIKWDYNRNFTEVYSQGLPPEKQSELAHRFILGTYELMERLLTAFPHILLESCSGGGGRYDAGMLYYSPQVWTSDNTDGIDREHIQFGTSLCYPAASMGSHVSHNGRLPGKNGLKVKGDVAMWGTFGYELNPTVLDEEECEEVKRQCANYHKYYDLIHKGDLYRLEYPNENPCGCAWEFAAPDKSEALLTVVVNLARTDRPVRFIRLRGLDPDKYYTVENDNAETQVFSGALLMGAGLNVTYQEAVAWDKGSYTFYISEKK